MLHLPYSHNGNTMIEHNLEKIEIGGGRSAGNRSWFWSKVLSLQLICSPTLTAANFQIKPCHHGQSISTEIFSRYLILRDSDSKSQEGEEKISFPL